MPWDKVIADRIIVTTRSAQPTGVPGVDPLAVGGREKDENGLGRTRLGRLRCPIFVHNAATIPPGAVINPAGKRLAAADPVTTGGDVGDTARAQGAGNDRIGGAVDFARAS